MQIQGVFEVLGSNLNPTLTQLAKTKRVVFVEGKDFSAISQFARKLGKNQIANRSDFAVIPVEGYNPKRVKEFSKGMEFTLGTKILKAVIFDRDYRSDSEIMVVEKEFKEYCSIAWIHKRKEIENYALEVTPLERAIKKRIIESNSKSGKSVSYNENTFLLLMGITDNIKEYVRSQYLAKRIRIEKIKTPGVDESNIYAIILKEFEDAWETLNGRLKIVPGKEVLSLLNQHLQEEYGISISIKFIIDCYSLNEIPEDIHNLIISLEDFRKMYLTG